MGYAVGAVVAIALIALFAWAFQRSKRKSAAARVRARAAEADLFATAEALTRTAATEDPEKEAAKARVAAIWGNKQAERAAALEGDRVYEYAQQDTAAVSPPAALQSFLPEQVPADLPGLSGTAAGEPTPLPFAAARTAPRSAAVEIAQRLRTVASRIEQIESSAGSPQEKADQITLLLAREWSSLPLDRLQGGSSIR